MRSAMMWGPSHVPLGAVGPGMVRVLPRHIRLQDAGSIDLTYAKQELDQEFSQNLLPLHCFPVVPRQRSNQETT